MWEKVNIKIFWFIKSIEKVSPFHTKRIFLKVVKKAVHEHLLILLIVQIVNFVLRRKLKHFLLKICSVGVVLKIKRIFNSKETFLICIEDDIVFNI